MPYKFSYDRTKTKINGLDDRRRKLTDNEREEIKQLYGTISQRKLAKKYGVSRRLIIFIGRPETYKRNLYSRARRGGSQQYYDKFKHKNYMKIHRNYKKDLFDEEALHEGRTMGKLKQKCPLCKEWFVSDNGNRKYCYTCSPKTEWR